MITGEIFFSNLSSGQQNLSNDVKKLCQKRLVKKSKFVLRKKTHPEQKHSVNFVSKVGTSFGRTTDCSNVVFALNTQKPTNMNLSV